MIVASYHAAGGKSNGAATSQHFYKVLFFSVRITLTRAAIAIAIARVVSRAPTSQHSKDTGRVSVKSGTKTQC
jgi:hypothetical protein